MKHFENLSIKDIEGETWVDVVGYEGLYLVSNFARVKSVRRVHIMKNLVHRPITERILKQTLDYFGYLKITLWKDAKSLSKKSS